MDSDQFIEKMLIVRHRIINIFTKSIDPRTKKGIPGNYLMGVGSRVMHLREYLHNHINSRGILQDCELPNEFRCLNNFWRNIVISKIVQAMINLQVDEMRNNVQLWYFDQSGGIWEISQSLADEYKSASNEYLSVYESLSCSTKPKYRDQRNYHGRPSKQARRRNKKLRQAPGLSISIARYK